MRCIKSDKGGVIDGKSNQRSLDKNASLLARHYQIHHVPSCSEEFPSAVAPEAIWHCVLLPGERGFVKWTNGLVAAQRQEGQVRRKEAQALCDRWKVEVIDGSVLGRRRLDQYLEIIQKEVGEDDGSSRRT